METEAGNLSGKNVSNLLLAHFPVNLNTNLLWLCVLKSIEAEVPSSVNYPQRLSEVIFLFVFSGFNVFSELVLFKTHCASGVLPLLLHSES